MQTPQKDNPSTLTPRKSANKITNPSLSKISSRPTESDKPKSPPPKMQTLSPSSNPSPSGRGRRKTRKSHKTRRVKKVNG